MEGCLMETCYEHSGLSTSIINLQKSDSKQWEEIAEMRKITDKIMTRLNVILGGVLIAAIGLLLNIVFKVY